MALVGAVIAVFGQAYSSLLLHIYGGQRCICIPIMLIQPSRHDSERWQGPHTAQAVQRLCLHHVAQRHDGSIFRSSMTLPYSSMTMITCALAHAPALASGVQRTRRGGAQLLDARVLACVCCCGGGAVSMDWSGRPHHSQLHQHAAPCWTEVPHCCTDLSLCFDVTVCFLAVL